MTVTSNNSDNTIQKSTLVAKGLSKAYKGNKVVKSVSLEVSAGQIVGLLGPNGAGKTTSFYMIVGLVPNDDGQIILNNEDVTLAPMHERARRGIGYLPQEASIFRKLTVIDNIMAILQTRKGLSENDRQAKLEHLLEEFNISHIKDNLGMSLSGGERRRVEIARALAAEPEFILLDEPFAGIDPIAVGDIQKIVCDLRDQDGLSILITDHSVRETLHIVDHAYLLHEGKLILEGEAKEIAVNPLARKHYLGEDFVL